MTVAGWMVRRQIAGGQTIGRPFADKMDSDLFEENGQLDRARLNFRLEETGLI
jgi:hypothetical protein